MPRLPGERDLGGLPSGRSGRAVATVDTTAEARAYGHADAAKGMIDLGRGFQQLSAGLHRAGQRSEANNEERALNETKSRLALFRQNWDRDITERQRNAPAGAAGFAASLDADYDAAAREFLAATPEPARQYADAALLRGRGIVASTGLAFENRSHDLKAVADIDTYNQTALANINPDNYDSTITGMSDYATGQGLPADALYGINAKNRRAALNHLGAWYIDNDPGALRGMLNPYTGGNSSAGGRLGGLISSGEGNYNSFNRGTVSTAGTMDLASMTVGQIMARQASGGPSHLGAVGKYQVIGTTLAGAVKHLGIDPNTPFTPELQEHIFRNYLIDAKRPDVKAYITGQSDNRIAALEGLALEFASVAHHETGRSAYHGIAGNRSSIDAGSAGQILDAERAAYQQNLAEGMSPEDAWAALSNSSGNSATSVMTQDNFSSRHYSWEDLRNDRFPNATMNGALINVLDDVTELFGKGPLQVTSGYRSPSHNRAVSGAENSQHMGGHALDIVVSGYTDEEKARLVAMFIERGAGGVGHYANGTIHVDLRNSPGKGPGGLALWYGKQAYTQGEAWFKQGVDAGLQARTAAGGSAIQNNAGVDPRFAGLPLADRQRLLRQADARVRANGTEFLSGSDDYLAYLASGNDPDIETRFTEENIRAMLEPDKAQALLAAIADARLDGRAVSEVRGASQEEIMETRQRYVNEIQSEPENFKYNTARLERYDRALNARNTAMLNDPAVYTLQNDENTSDAYHAMIDSFQDTEASPDVRQQAVARYTAAARSMQTHLGIPPELQTLLPKEYVATIGRQFKAQDEGGQNAAQMVQLLQAQWGKEWPQVFKEISSELPVAAQVIGTMTRPDQRMAAEGLAEAALIGEKALKETIGTDAAGDVTKAVVKHLAEFRGTLVGRPGGLNTISAYNESIRLLAMKYAMEGDTPSNAAARAYDDVLGRVYNFHESFRAPVEYDFNRVVNGSVQSLENIKQYDFDIPPDPWGNLTPEQEKDAYIDALQNKGRWQTSSDESGLVLYDETGAVVTSGGKPLVFPWKDLIETPSADLPRRRRGILGGRHRDPDHMDRLRGTAN